MPKCIIDGREVEFTLGENVIETARRVKVDIPYFCYHPGLSVVAQCRMCMVEIEKMPKLQTACSTKTSEGMVIKTKSEKAMQGQKATMEFLLINHPLDCPICDKSGECDLQDFSFDYGGAHSRYTEERRTYIDQDMGPVIKKNMNRCIHCTRCIRFADEIAGIREMVAVNRGNNTEICTVSGGPLETEYAGNYADICPTGSLTIKDFRFRKRVWYLKKTRTVCEGCSRGCNMEIHEDANVIHRCLPVTNLEINKYWLCDEGRFNFKYLQSQERVLTPFVNDHPSNVASVGNAGQVSPSDWINSIETSKKKLMGRSVCFLIGSDLTNEEVFQVQDFSLRFFPGAPIFHFGTPGISAVSEDGPYDKILKRLNKTANLNGVEKLGIRGFKKMPQGVQIAVVIRGGKAVLPSDLPEKSIGIGVFMKSELSKFLVVLPGLSFAEKDGTVVNFQGKEQKLKRALRPLGESKSLSEIFMMWSVERTPEGLRP